MSASQGQRIGRARSLADAIALLRAQRLLLFSVIRINSETRCGQIVVEDQKYIIDALVDNDDMPPQHALIALLSVTEADFELIRLPDSAKDDVRHALNVNLRTVARKVSTSAEQQEPVDDANAESHSLIEQDVRRERPILGWQKGRSIKDSLVESSSEMPQRGAPHIGLLVPMLLLLVPLAVVAIFAARPQAPLPINQAPAADKTTAPAAASAPTDEASPRMAQASTPAQSAAHPAARPISPSSVGDLNVADKELDKLDRQMQRASKLQSEGKSDEAIEGYSTILGRFPKFVQPRIAIIKICMLKGDYKQAAYFCEEGMRKAANTSDYRYFSQLLAKIPSQP